MTLKILQISPYEPPASGWVSRIKLLRRVIEQRGGRCEILDIGPNRTIDRPGCIPVYGGRDFLVKAWRHARAGFTLQTHINGEYFRGMLLALAALVLFRVNRRRCLTTFHAGADQSYFRGWRGYASAGFYWLVFALSHAVVCNSEVVKTRLSRLVSANKIYPIAAFSRQYLNYQPVPLAADAEQFCRQHQPLISIYLCYRPGFFTATLIDAMQHLVAGDPQLGLIIVGTGPEQDDFAETLRQRGLADNVFLAGDVAHDPFLTLIARSALHLRTPTSDGVSSTVLEALHLGTAVVAADNGTRPAGVVLYRADDAAAMAAAIERTLSASEQIRAAVTLAPLDDTAAWEVDLLAGESVIPSASSA